MANGERVSYTSVLCSTAFTIEGAPFAADLFIMPLAGYDVVLGTQWMTGLGPLTWDFTAGTLSFKRQGKVVCWRGADGPDAPALVATTTGAPASSAPTAERPLLDVVLAAFDNVFTEPRGLPP